MDVGMVLTKLSRKGYRITRQRQRVVEVVLASPCLQSAQEIYQCCQVKDESISYPTIYRTLDMLVETGMVRRLHFGQDRSWYEPWGQRQHHHHLICRNCGDKVIMYSCPQQLIKQEAQRHGFQVLDHNFEILGLCADCQLRGGEVME